MTFHAGQVQSVFDLMSARDRDRLLSAKTGHKPLQQEEVPNQRKEVRQAERQEVIERKERGHEEASSVGMAIATGCKSFATQCANHFWTAYQPYASDPHKQNRYKLYLSGHRNFTGMAKRHVVGTSANCFRSRVRWSH